MKCNGVLVLSWLLMACSSLSVVAEERVGDWTVALGSESYAERKAALDSIIGYRQELFTGLMSLIERPVAPGEPFFDRNTTRNMAICLLGLYRFEEAAPALIDRLSINPIQDGTQDNPLIPPPAAQALRRLGASAAPLLLQKLKTTTDVLMADQCVKALCDIEGTAEAGRQIREAILHEQIPAHERVLRLLDALEAQHPDQPD